MDCFMMGKIKKDQAEIGPELSFFFKNDNEHKKQWNKKIEQAKNIGN